MVQDTRAGATIVSRARILRASAVGVRQYLYIRKGGKHALTLYIFLYSVIRFFTEFLRWDDYRGHILFLSTSQAVSLALFITVSAYFIIIHHRGRKKA